MPANTPNLQIPYALPNDPVTGYPTAVDKPKADRLDALVKTPMFYASSQAFVQTTATSWTVMDAALQFSIAIPAADAGWVSVLLRAVIPNALSVNGGIRSCFSFIKDSAEVSGAPRGLSYIVGAQRDSLAITWLDYHPAAGTHYYAPVFKLDAAGGLQVNDVAGMSYFYGQFVRSGAPG